MNANHTQKAIECQHYFSDFFGAESRKNTNAFENAKDEKRELIYNYYPVQVSESFMSVYVFSKPTAKEPHKSFFRSKKGNLILFTRDRNKSKSVFNSSNCKNYTILVGNLSEMTNGNSTLGEKHNEDIEETLKSLESENEELQSVERLYFDSSKKFTEKKFIISKGKTPPEFLAKDIYANEQELEPESS